MRGTALCTQPINLWERMLQPPCCGSWCGPQQQQQRRRWRLEAAPRGLLAGPAQAALYCAADTGQFLLRFGPDCLFLYRFKCSNTCGIVKVRVSHLAARSTAASSLAASSLAASSLAAAAGHILLASSAATPACLQALASSLEPLSRAVHGITCLDHRSQRHLHSISGCVHQGQAKLWRNLCSVSGASIFSCSCRAVLGQQLSPALSSQQQLLPDPCLPPALCPWPPPHRRHTASRAARVQGM